MFVVIFVTVAVVQENSHRCVIKLVAQIGSGVGTCYNMVPTDLQCLGESGKIGN